MKNNWDNKQTEELLKAIITLDNLDEAKLFFRDLLTEEELIEFGKRWQTAQLLSDKISYSKIEEITGLSSTTIARVAKWLNNGQNGYKLMIEKISSHHNNSSSETGLF
jgi:TrpR-related protein YerC/YecD